MTGKSHFTLGCAVAGAIAYLGVQDNNVGQVAMTLTIPFGAMLPDIDHDMSKLGQKRVKIVNYIKLAIKVVCVLYALDLAYMIVINKQEPAAVITGSLVSYGPILFAILVTHNPIFRSKTKFFRKHRGIMHTLFPIGGLILGAYMLKGGFMSMLLTGVSTGYATHLFADQETKMGNPLLWPLTDKNVPGLPIRAGSAMEYVMLMIDIGVVICLTMILSRR